MNGLLRTVRSGDGLLLPWVLDRCAACSAGRINLQYTRFGRHLFANRSNERTARLCGVRVDGGRLLSIRSPARSQACGRTGVFALRLAIDRRCGRRARSDRGRIIGAELVGRERPVIGTLAGAAIMTVIQIVARSMACPTGCRNSDRDLIVLLSLWTVSGPGIGIDHLQIVCHSRLHDDVEFRCGCDVVHLEHQKFPPSREHRSRRRIGRHRHEARLDGHLRIPDGGLAPSDINRQQSLHPSCGKNLRPVGDQPLHTSLARTMTRSPALRKVARTLFWAPCSLIAYTTHRPSGEKSHSVRQHSIEERCRLSSCSNIQRCDWNRHVLCVRQNAARLGPAHGKRTEPASSRSAWVPLTTGETVYKLPPRWKVRRVPSGVQTARVAGGSRRRDPVPRLTSYSRSPSCPASLVPQRLHGCHLATVVGAKKSAARR